MALQAKYDPREDRMRLTLHPAEGDPHVFWVTRRQWLGLLHALAGVPAGEAKQESAAAPASRQRRLFAHDPERKPIPLQGIRLRRLANGVKLVFVPGAQGVGVDLTPEGVAQLRAMLWQQAERAGWDVTVALARLDAATLANAALKDARKLN